MNPIKAVREMKEMEAPKNEEEEEEIDYERMDKQKAEVLKNLEEFVENFSTALDNILYCANRIQKLIKDHNIEEGYIGLKTFIESIPKKDYIEVDDYWYSHSFDHTLFELADCFRDNEHPWSQGWEMDDLVTFFEELLKDEKTKV